MTRLHELPADILLDIAFILPLADLLSLKQTCRAMYTFVCTDYLWHQIAAKAQIPLDLPGRGDLGSYSGHDLQRIMLKAIRLDRNWRRPVTTIKSLVSFAPAAEPDRLSIDEMVLCGASQWLVTAQRNRPLGRSSVTFSFWSIRDMRDVYRAAIVEVTGEYKHFAVVHDESRERASLAVTATFCKEEIIKFYDVPLHQRLDAVYATHDAPRLVRTISKPTHLSGLFDAVAMDGDIVAATIVDVCRTQPILLVNTVTGAQCLADPACEVSLRMTVKFQSGNLVLTHTTKDSVGVRVHTLPDASEWSHADTPPVLALRAPLASHQIALPNAADVRVSHTLGVSPSPADAPSFVAFDLGTQMHCTRLPSAAPGAPDAAAPAHAPAPAQKLQLPEMSSVEAVALGAHRGAWLERNWEIDEVRVMRFWWARLRDGSVVPKMGVLVPPNPDLPLQPADVRALALDETTGRLCLGTYSGSVFVLDYVDDL